MQKDETLVTLWIDLNEETTKSAKRNWLEAGRFMPSDKAAVVVAMDAIVIPGLGTCDIISRTLDCEQLDDLNDGDGNASKDSNIQNGHIPYSTHIKLKQREADKQRREYSHDLNVPVLISCVKKAGW